jgi:protein-tyrosine phosphatase
MPQAVKWLLGPYLLGAWINSRLWTRNDAAAIEVVPDVWLGRFPSAGDVRLFASVVDLTAELPRPAFQGIWRAIPMLDLVAPEPTALAAAAGAIDEARASGPVLVCCALGYGRSVVAVAAWLVRAGCAADPAAALDLLRQRRPRLSVGPAQIEAIGKALRD